MNRIESFILKFIVCMFLFIPGEVLAESPQFPAIDRMEIPKLELDIEVKKYLFRKNSKHGILPKKQVPYTGWKVHRIRNMEEIRSSRPITWNMGNRVRYSV